MLLAWCLAGLSKAQHDPLEDFCRRWGHQSAVVDGKLYIDGGMVNYKPFTSRSQNLSNTFFAYSDIDTVSSEGMPPMYANLSKNATIPSVSGGILWEDSVNKRLYLYGGETYQTPPSEFELFSYDILHNDWVSFGSPAGSEAIYSVSYGAGVSLPDRGEAYYYGGWLSNASVPDWSGPPVATSRLIKYEMDTNSWSNITGPDDVGRAEGTMVFLPIGDAGMLVYFGGTKDLYGNGTLTPQPLDEIFLYDVANTKWYTQKTSGRTPEIRRRFCGGATWAQDRSSYNTYIYGGAGFPPHTTGYDDIYILSIPSFQWIRGPYPVGSNVTGPYPKSMMSCNVVHRAQMLVIGGTYSNDTTFSCDADAVWGEHNMDLGEQNEDKAMWALYKPNLTSYVVPTDIVRAVGGDEKGGATKTAPVSGFDEPDLAVLMTRQASAATRTPTRSVSTSTATPTASSSSGLSTGAIVGIAVGCSVAGILLLVGAICLCLRRRKRARQQPPTAPSANYGMAMAAPAPVPLPFPQPQPQQTASFGGYSQQGWNHTHVSSPVETAGSPGFQQPKWGSVPSELADGRHNSITPVAELYTTPSHTDEGGYPFPRPIDQGLGPTRE
ncbi:hypothetical protein B0I35DRAFT_480501 [Stachybotrys elegans]|uniref:Kelch repeat-containing protein n=1 Tax=Stachybotrys elegans TaxID=80388 RepID=A0A8K0SP81_9HYPO|nr:hypothetical protein B0I35DRAFT_480501 [Stachybotrys elegans]